MSLLVRQTPTPVGPGRRDNVDSSPGRSDRLAPYAKQSHHDGEQHANRERRIIASWNGYCGDFYTIQLDFADEALRAVGGRSSEHPDGAHVGAEIVHHSHIAP